MAQEFFNYASIVLNAFKPPYQNICMGFVKSGIFYKSFDMHLLCSKLCYVPTGTVYVCIQILNGLK